MTQPIPEKVYEQALSLDQERFRLEKAQNDTRMQADIRRFSVEAANRFFSNSNRGLISFEAILHAADLCRAYIEHGLLPDAAQTRQSVEDTARNVAESAFPSTLQQQLRQGGTPQ